MMEQVRFRRPEPSDPLDQRKAAIITKPCCVLARSEVLLGRQADITGHMVFTLRLVRQTKLRSVCFRRCLETVKTRHIISGVKKLVDLFRSRSRTGNVT